MVVLDATMLMMFVNPAAERAKDRSGRPVSKPADRVAHLIDQLEKTRETIAVPTPALSEVLVRLGAQRSQQVVEQLNRTSVFSIESFDQRAAIELAAMLREELDAGQKRPKGGPQTWAKLKFDRQIVAIARVLQASVIYTDDEDVEKLAGRAKMRALRLCDLPLPPVDPQIPITFRSE